MPWSLWLSPQASGIGNHIYVMMVMIQCNETKLIRSEFFTELSLTMSYGGRKENVCKIIDIFQQQNLKLNFSLQKSFSESSP